MPARKSDDHYIDLPEGLGRADLMALVERAAERAGLYISHIGGYSRKKYPNSVHWHFKRDPKEPGLIDATFWDVEHLFWLMVRHSEPAWVQAMVPRLLRAFRREVRQLGARP
ncbi:MAG: hypothetical protein AAGI15_09015 [Pseudomonadota bacterium]